MIDLVLDANVAIDWFLSSPPGEEYSRPLIGLAGQSKARLHVPLHFDVEVCGQLVKRHRRHPKEFGKTWLESCLGILDNSPIEIHAIGMNFRLLGDLSTAYGLTVYDVPYFHLARMMDTPIASRDRGIMSACKAWGVPHWQP